MAKTLIPLIRALWNRTVRKRRHDEALQVLGFNFQQDEATKQFNAEMRFKHPGMILLAREAVDMFRETNAVNYLDFTAFDETTFQGYTITIQRQQGLSPGHINQILRQALTAIYSDTGNPTAAKALQRCGYPLPGEGNAHDQEG